MQLPRRPLRSRLKWLFLAHEPQGRSRRDRHRRLEGLSLYHLKASNACTTLRTCALDIAHAIVPLLASRLWELDSHHSFGLGVGSPIDQPFIDRVRHVQDLNICLSMEYFNATIETPRLLHTSLKRHPCNPLFKTVIAGP